MTINTRY